MNTALRTDDLIREIFSHLRVSGHDDASNDTTTLYNAALSCKRFSCHALDSLWFSTYDLRPLMALIPSSKETHDASLRSFIKLKSCLTMLQGGIYLTEPLRREDLRAFDHYAIKIKEYYYYGPEMSAQIGAPIMLDLLQCLNRHFLLPNLRWLQFEHCDLESGSSDKDFNCFFLCPTIQHLSIIFDDANHLRSTFPRIVQLAPHLRFLDVHSIAISDDQLPLLSRFHSLQELSTRNHFIISSEVSNNLPLPNQLRVWRLGSISIEQGSTNLMSSFDRFYSITPQFALLAELQFYAPKMIEALAEVFAHGLFPKLKTLILGCCHPAYSRNSGWQKLFSAIFSKENCLDHIETYDSVNSLQNLANFDNNDIFGPLKDCSPQVLTTLQLSISPLTILPTSSIHIMVKIFPHLTDISIYLQPAAYISFTDLALLAQGLPHLVSLRIGIRGTTPVSAIPILSHRLTQLSLHNSSIKDPVYFARRLDRIFPFVSVEYCNLNESTSISKLQRALAIMKSCREDQEARIIQTV